MIRVRVFKIFSGKSCDPISGKEVLAPMENFIAQIGYDNIKNIIVSAPDTLFSFYSIFYEDGLPYTPPPVPEKKGLFGF